MGFSDRLRGKDPPFAATSRAAQRRKELALYIFLASLAMFFSAAVVGYLLVRRGRAGETLDVDLPWGFWLSTAFAFAGSGFLWRSLRSIRRERREAFRRQLVAAFALGLAFCVTQSVCLAVVLRDHLVVSKAVLEEAERREDERRARLAAERVSRRMVQPDPAKEPPAVPDADPEVHLGGLLFCVVGLHALHFLGGMAALSVVTWRGLAGRYDHEYHGGLRLCALYWRFLDAVWVVLFGTFLLTT